MHNNFCLDRVSIKAMKNNTVFELFSKSNALSFQKTGLQN